MGEQISDFIKASELKQENNTHTQNQPNSKYQTKTTSSSSIKVHPNQRGNPLLNHIRSSPWIWIDTDLSKVGDNVPDYQIGSGNALLFLSLRYHKIHPEYIYNRLKSITGYRLTVLLIQVDVPDHHDSLQELHMLSFNSNITLFLSWSAGEAAKYIESFKQMENKSIETLHIKNKNEDISDRYIKQMNESLTKIRTINKTDALTLSAHFKNFRELANADIHRLSLCPGLGDKKVAQLRKVFSIPFSTTED